MLGTEVIKHALSSDTSLNGLCEGVPPRRGVVPPHLMHRLPLGIPIKIAIIEIYQARRGRWGEGKDAFLLSFPFPSCLARFPFLRPSLPMRREASAEERRKRPINAKHGVSIAIGSHIVDKEWETGTTQICSENKDMAAIAKVIKCY